MTSVRNQITALGACIGDFEQWIIDEQRREKSRKKAKRKPRKPSKETSQ